MTNGSLDILVAGSGPAGLMAASLLARSGFSVALLGPRPDHQPTSDARTAALFPSSLAVVARALDRVDRSWLNALQPLTAIRIRDGHDWLLKAPEVVFRSSDIGLERLATNVPLLALTWHLAEALTAMPGVDWIAERVDAVEIGGTDVALTTDQGQCIRARLVIAADGHGSRVRQAAGIGCETTDFDQTAIVAAFDHSVPHDGVSTEIHRPGGPCTTVPLPGNRSSLVWLERAAIADRLMALDDAAFLATLARHVGGHCGQLSNVTRRASLAMRGQTARTMAGNRVALVGETAHVFPPIGAQGLNLTIRDIVALEEVLGAARRAGRDIGGPETLGAYAAARRGDVTLRARGVAMINSTLLADWPLPNLARGAALHAIAAVPALKRQIMRAGLG